MTGRNQKWSKSLKELYHPVEEVAEEIDQVSLTKKARINRGCLNSHLEMGEMDETVKTDKMESKEKMVKMEGMVEMAEIYGLQVSTELSSLKDLLKLLSTTPRIPSDSAHSESRLSITRKHKLHQQTIWQSLMSSLVILKGVSERQRSSKWHIGTNTKIVSKIYLNCITD